jgi:hypothetical protein
MAFSTHCEELLGKQGAPQKLEEEKHNCNLAPYDIEIIDIF